MAIAAAVSNLVELYLFDFVHGNPHRSRENALEMMALYSPMFALVAFIGMVLCFGPFQCFQAVAQRYLSRRVGDRLFMTLALLQPIAAVITWYSYDYLTPSDFNLAINTDADWQPYQHGITVTRYLGALAAQLPITLFSALYVSTAKNLVRRATLVAIALMLAISAGVIWGYHLSEIDIRLL